MRVTVLIANHNYGRYLKKAIDSALNQTFQPSCICICDDNSTDDSWDIISEYASNNQTHEEYVDSPIGVVCIKIGNINKTDIVGIKLPVTSGPSVARNYGIDVTMKTTDVYAILDSDDEMLPNKIEECLNPFVHKDVVGVYANYFHVDETTGTKIIEVKEPYNKIRLNQECIIHSGSLIRASALEKVKDNNGYYDCSMRTCEDWELWLRLSNIGIFYHIPKALTHVLIHPNNSTFSVNKDIWLRNWKYIGQKHFGET